jgi:hypothetical protein
MPTNSTGAFSISGWKGGGVQWHVDPVDLVKTTVADALLDTADWLLEEANRTVPHRDGYLQDSGGTDYAELFGVQVAAIYYGGVASAYAVAQHEHPEWKHRDNRRGKWLELTAQELADQVSGFMAGRIGKRLS